MASQNKAPHYRLRVPDEIIYLVRGSHPQLKRKIRAALQRIVDKPYEGKSLRAELNELRSFKVSRFRIIYRIASKDIIDIVAIGPRKTIYEETFYLIQKEEKKSKIKKEAYDQSLPAKFYPKIDLYSYLFYIYKNVYCRG